MQPLLLQRLSPGEHGEYRQLTRKQRTPGIGAANNSLGAVDARLVVLYACTSVYNDDEIAPHQFQRAKQPAQQAEPEQCSLQCLQ